MSDEVRAPHVPAGRSPRRRDGGEPCHGPLSGILVPKRIDPGDADTTLARLRGIREFSSFRPSNHMRRSHTPFSSDRAVRRQRRLTECRTMSHSAPVRPAGAGAAGRLFSRPSGSSSRQRCGGASAAGTQRGRRRLRGAGRPPSNAARTSGLAAGLTWEVSFRIDLVRWGQP
jgi:hypothetical protein